MEVQLKKVQGQFVVGVTCPRMLRIMQRFRETRSGNMGSNQMRNSFSVIWPWRDLNHKREEKGSAIHCGPVETLLNIKTLFFAYQLSDV